MLRKSDGEMACSIRWVPEKHYDAGMRLLLVEDDTRIARFVAKGLREQSYAVDLAVPAKKRCTRWRSILTIC